MEIKQITGKKPIDLSEWNDEIVGYVKELAGFETLAFNDLFATFYSKENDYETRFNAGFDAAMMVLVDENDQPILTENDRDAVKKASFAPIVRVFTTGFSNETVKKN